MIDHQVGSCEKIAAQCRGLATDRVVEELLDGLVVEPRAVVADLDERCHELAVGHADGESGG